MEADRLLGLQLRHFAALDAVGRTGSFGRAAVELGYTQSAVSQQIAQLERIVGQKLVERPGGPRRVSLTDAGRLLLRHAGAVTAQIAAASADMAALAEGAAGPLRIGIYQSVGARFLPGLLRHFVDAWPRVEVRLHEEADDAVLLQLVERGELDMTFCDLPLEPGPFEAVELLRDDYVLLVDADSPLAGREQAPPRRELEGLPLIAWRSSTEAEDALRGRVPNLRVVFRTDDNGTLVGLVAEGMGVAVVPRLVVNPRNPAVRALAFGNRIPPRLIGLAWHRDRYRSAAAKAFVEEAQRVGETFSLERRPAAPVHTGRPSA